MSIAAFFRNPIRTYCTVQGDEMNVVVSIDYQPHESDTNVGEYAEVTEVLANGVSVLDSMLQDEVEELEERVLELAYSTVEAADEDRADRAA